MNCEYIDVHAHLNFAAFDADREEVISRAREARVAVINVGTQADTSKKAVELAEKHDHMWAIVGLHPIHTSKSYHDMQELGEGGQEFTSRGETLNSAIYRELLRHPKVVGLGECGLDYYRLDADTAKKQKEAFITQIELANEAKKPLMLHIRQAYADAHDILKAHATVPANVHFFAGTWDEAKKFLDLGCTLSFTGAITFAKNYEEVVRNVPLDRVLSETDCPYVAPTPFRGKRNEPLYVREVVKRIAQIKGIEHDMVRKAICDNAERLFRIGI